MERQTKLDPFNYGTWNVATSLVQLATTIIGLVMLMQGNEAGLLALGALAGGTKGNLIGDFLQWYRSNGPKPPLLGGTLLALVLAMAVMLVGCGTTVSKQFLVDSQTAAMSAASDYLGGCRTVTVAPAFTVDWNQNVTYGGGLFAGCEAKGRLVEFRCVGMQDEETGKVRVQCQPLSLWQLAPDRPVREEKP
jgi:hypothetical protein